MGPRSPRRRRDRRRRDIVARGAAAGPRTRLAPPRPATLRRRRVGAADATDAAGSSPPRRRVRAADATGAAGHELAHLLLGHTEEKLYLNANVYLFQLIVLAFLDPTGLLPFFGAESLRQTASLFLAKNSRSHEDEADRVGLEIAFAKRRGEIDVPSDAGRGGARGRRRAAAPPPRETPSDNRLERTPTDGPGRSPPYFSGPRPVSTCGRERIL